MQDLIRIYREIKQKVDERLADFELIRQYGTEEEYFIELVFCLLTPQTKARQAEKAVMLLKERNLLFRGSAADLGKYLNIVRFRYHKAEYIVRARKSCSINGEYALKSLLAPIPEIKEKREWLVKNIKGMSWKEASHFLRNTGHGTQVAILDRHVLKNLVRLKIIKEIPASLNESRYLEIESKLSLFAIRSGIPLEYLDYVLWYRETGDIFK